MTYSDQHIAGYRRASKDAAAWLQMRAGQMNDAKARDILHAAADHLGAELKANAAKMREGKERPDTAIRARADHPEKSPDKPISGDV